MASRSPKTRPLAIGYAIAVAVILLDQLTKWWVRVELMRPPRVIEITPFFNLVYGWNRGISFGIFNNDDATWNAWALSLAALVIVGALTVWLVRTTSPLVRVALACVIGGAIGNVIDRVRFGAVFDFLDFHVAGYHWPAFNVADSAITCGAVVLLIDGLFLHSEQRSKLRSVE